MSARNRELFALIPVALLVTAASRRSSSSRSDEIGDASLIYGGYFLAICLAAHFFLRVALPHADPYLFPLCAVLAAVGLVVLYRIDETLARRAGDRFPARPRRCSPRRSSSCATTTCSSATAT